MKIEEININYKSLYGNDIVVLPYKDTNIVFIAIIRQKDAHKNWKFISPDIDRIRQSKFFEFVFCECLFCINLPTTVNDSLWTFLNMRDESCKC